MPDNLQEFMKEFESYYLERIVWIKLMDYTNMGCKMGYGIHLNINVDGEGKVDEDGNEITREFPEIYLESYEEAIDLNMRLLSRFRDHKRNHAKEGEK